MKTSSGEAASPGLDGRSSSTVVAGRGGGGFFLAFVHFSLHSWSPECPILASDSAIGRVYSEPAVPQRRRTP